jgi:hypothetical protein
MLVIRQEQIEVFRQYVFRQFEDRVFAHFAAVFPQEFNKLGETGAREIIRAGIDRAGNYGFVSEYDMARYIELMFMVGEDFDENSDRSWAAEILNQDSYDSPSSKMDDLFRAAANHAEKKAETEAGQ